MRASDEVNADGADASFGFCKHEGNGDELTAITDFTLSKVHQLVRDGPASECCNIM